MDEHEAQERAGKLKERIYVTFSALAVVLALRAHDGVEASEALVTLLVTVAGTLLAVFVAELVAHLVAHRRMWTDAELRHAVSVSTSALGAIATPVVFLVLANFEVWRTDRALRASMIALIAALVAFSFAAIRHVPLSFWERLFALGALAVLGLAVIGLELLAHM